MYLTKITVDGIAIQKHHLFDAYRWKQQLCKSVPPIETTTGKDKVWPCRFVVKESSRNVSVLFQSPTPPAILPFGKWETKQIPSNFLSCDKYYFEVLANPTIKKACFDESGSRKKQGKNMRLEAANTEEWIRRKLTNAGCELNSVSKHIIGPVLCFRKEKIITSHAVKYSGLLTVQNRELFIKTFSYGIGRGKSFGFGLLLLKRI